MNMSAHRYQFGSSVQQLFSAGCILFFPDTICNYCHLLYKLEAFFSFEHVFMQKLFLYMCVCKRIYIYIYIYTHTHTPTPAQLSVAIEYAAYISEESTNTYPTSVLDMILNHLMVRINSWNFRECEYLFITIALWNGSAC